MLVKWAIIQYYVYDCSHGGDDRHLVTNFISIWFEIAVIMFVLAEFLFILLLQFTQFTHCKKITNNVNGDELIFAQTVSRNDSLCHLSLPRVFNCYYHQPKSCVGTVIGIRTNHIQLIHGNLWDGQADLQHWPM